MTKPENLPASYSESVVFKDPSNPQKDQVCDSTQLTYCSGSSVLRTN